MVSACLAIYCWVLVTITSTCQPSCFLLAFLEWKYDSVKIIIVACAWFTFFSVNLVCKYSITGIIPFKQLLVFSWFNLIILQNGLLSLSIGLDPTIFSQVYNPHERLFHYYSTKFQWLQGPMVHSCVSSLVSSIFGGWHFHWLK